MVNLD